MTDREKKLKWMLSAVCLVMCAGVLFNFWICFSKLAILAGALNVSNPNVVITIVLDALTVFFDAIVLILFVRFSLAITRKGEFFSPKQTRRLLAMGVLYALIVIAGLLTPSFTVPAELAQLTGSLKQEPFLNLRVLLFSLIFFALSVIFEYGRMLQEDSNNIL